MHAGDWTTGDRLSEGVANLIAAARTLPMMSPRRVVVVSQAEVMLAPKRATEAAESALEQFGTLIEKPEPLTTLVLVAAALDKRTKSYKLLAKHATIVDCGSPEDVAGAARWVTARVDAVGVAIDPAGARALATLA